jgi:hypothetical protein
MSRVLKSFPELPLKLLPTGPIADTNVSPQFPAPGPQATFPGAAVTLEHPTGHPRAPFARTDGWHHGGINE